MKRIKALIIAVCLLMFASVASAAWSIYPSLLGGAEGKYIVKLVLLGDGTALSQNIWTTIKDVGANRVDGLYIYRVITIPDGTNAPSSTYEITLTDLTGDVATLAARSTTATESELTALKTVSKGYLSMNGYLLLTCEDIGAGNSTTIYLELVP
jgi:hypothetical protein